MAMNPGQISVIRGTYSDECTAVYDLVQNSANYPQIREMMDYVQRRQLSVLLTSGVVTPYGIKAETKTRIPNVETKSKPIGADAYQFRIMGRIERVSNILAQVGASGADGSFGLKMMDNSLQKGDTVTFYNRKQARVMTGPVASAGGYNYTFKTPSQEVFSYSTWVAAQTGTKWCFTSHTTFGEKSLKGYGYSKFPDMFVNHMTIQRQSISITGDANAQVLWYNYTNSANGKTAKGWMYEEVAQLRAKESVRHERAAWLGVSTMKDSSGNLLATSNQIDPDTGLPIIAGDGFEEQIAGGNVAYGSGTNGQPVLDDFISMMRTLQLKGNMTSGYTWLLVTGTDGFFNWQNVAYELVGSQGVQIMQVINQEGVAGGADQGVGYTFSKINFGGNTMICVQHPLFDDPLAYPMQTADGKSVLGSTVFIFPLNSGDEYNMEFLHKAANGVDRSFVEAKLNGMTGAPEAIISQEDAMTYAVLSQKMLNVYNTQLCGVIYPTA